MRTKTALLYRPLFKHTTLLSVIFGTVVEYYDYALYGFCASLFAENFFPDSDPTNALLKIFGIFLLGSLSKPLGSVFFGSVGDRFGRLVALKLSMLGIAVPTALIGLLPTYDQIGFVAPIFLIVCRLLQGMCTAGESDGVRIYIYESIGNKSPCLANSLTGMSCMLGIYLASHAATYAISLGNYRLPFLMGGLAGMVVFLIRNKMIEPDEAMLKKTEIFEINLKSVLLKNKKNIMCCALLCGSVGGLYHFYLVFLGHYLSIVVQWIDPKRMASYTSCAILLYTFFSPVAGWVADRVGPARLLKSSAFFLLSVVLLNVSAFYQGMFPFWLMGLTVIALSFFQAPGFVVLMQKIKVQERYRCMSLGHSLGSMILSGTTPFISLWLWNATELPMAPFGYFVFLALLGLVTAVKLTDRR